jgi:hypothetical protein
MPSAISRRFERAVTRDGPRSVVSKQQVRVSRQQPSGRMTATAAASRAGTTSRAGIG